jgi:hypothetical protein
LPGNFLRRTELHDGAIFRIDWRFSGLGHGSFPEMILDLLSYAA